MGTPPLLIGTERATVVPPQAREAGWGALVTMGVALILVGATDLGLALYPFQFANNDWRFSVLSSVANGLPMLGVGTLVVSVAALYGPSRWPKAVVVALNSVVLLAIVSAAIGFLTAVGTAFELAPAEVHLGLQKAVGKSMVIFTAFAVAHGVAAISCARALQRDNQV